MERLEELTRRYTQRRDARSGQRHTLAEAIRMAALEALLPEELERHCQLQRSRLDTNQKLREEVVLYAETEGYVAPKLGQVSKARRQRRSCGCYEPFPLERERTPPALAKEREQERWCEIIRTSKHTENSGSVLELRENRSSIEGLLGKATAAESRTVKFSWKGK